MREVNTEHQMVGWYKVAEMGAFYNEQVVRTQHEWQSEAPEALLLVYGQLKEDGNVSRRSGTSLTCAPFSLNYPQTQHPSRRAHCPSKLCG